MTTEQQNKEIQAIVWRLNAIVIEQMKRIPAHQLFGWKGEKLK